MIVPLRRMIVLAASVAGLAFAAPSHAASPVGGPISFWSSTAAAVSVPKGALPQGNRRVVKPSVILMYQDGSWDIERLRWSGWGSDVATATGISSASNGIPNQAAGKRIKRTAKVTLSDPGTFQGHHVYRCFALAVPSFPASDEQLCLAGHGGYDYLQSSARHLDAFLSPGHQVWCVMNPTAVSCFTGGAPPAATAHPAQRGGPLTAGGRVSTCFVANPGVSAVCTQNWDSSASVLKYGQTSEIGDFRCTSATTGISCILLTGKAAGKGFVITDTGVRRVG